MRRCIYGFCRRPHEVDGTLTEYGGLPDTVHRLIICDGPENSGRNMYRMPVARPDDARLGGGPPPAEGPRAHTDRARTTLERQPVDDREDRAETDEPALRRPAAGHYVD